MLKYRSCRNIGVVGSWLKACNRKRNPVRIRLNLEMAKGRILTAIGTNL